MQGSGTEAAGGQILRRAQDDNAEIRPARRPLPAAWLLTHSGITVRRFIGMHVMGAIFPLTAGLLLYGWRGLMTIAIVVLAAAGATLVWRRIGSRGQHLRYSHILWLALLLGLTLPAHLATRSFPLDGHIFLTWPLPAAAGVVLVILTWLLGGIGSSRVHPVIVAHLLLIVLFDPLLVPQYTLQRDRVFVGDVLNAGPGTAFVETRERWVSMLPVLDRDALRVEPTSQRLITFTTGTLTPDRAWLSLESLIRDRLPPLEDLIIGGHPGPIGASSAIAVIIGGMFLLYRGLIDYRVPLLIVLTAYAAMLILPVPVVITDKAVQWRWLAMREAGVGWPLAITFVNFQLMASPLLFTAFFLATAPAIRPMPRRARILYAMLVGTLSAGLMLYFSVSIGPYVAVLIIAMLTPLLDRAFRARTLV